MKDRGMPKVRRFKSCSSSRSSKEDKEEELLQMTLSYWLWHLCVSLYTGLLLVALVQFITPFSCLLIEPNFSFGARTVRAAVAMVV